MFDANEPCAPASCTGQKRANSSQLHIVSACLLHAWSSKVFLACTDTSLPPKTHTFASFGVLRKRETIAANNDILSSTSLQQSALADNLTPVERERGQSLNSPPLVHVQCCCYQILDQLSAPLTLSLLFLFVVPQPQRHPLALKPLFF